MRYFYTMPKVWNTCNESNYYLAQKSSLITTKFNLRANSNPIWLLFNLRNLIFRLRRLFYSSDSESHEPNKSSIKKNLNISTLKKWTKNNFWPNKFNTEFNTANNKFSFSISYVSLSSTYLFLKLNILTCTVVFSKHEK